MSNTTGPISGAGTVYHSNKNMTDLGILVSHYAIRNQTV